MSKSPFKKNMKTPEVTPLTPPNGLTLGNFSDWKTSLQNSPEFAHLLGKGMIIFHTGHKAKPKPVTDATWNAPPQVEGAAEALALPAALTAKRREQVYSRYDVEAADIEKSYESCFWILWGTISEESKNKVKILAGARWMELQTSCDTQLLFQLITESHHTKAFGAGDVNALLNASALEAQMQSLKQDDSSLSQFAHKYRETRIACTVGGCSQVSVAADAVNFTLKLNPFTYGSMLIEMKRKAARQDPDAYPVTIDIAVAIAESWTPVEDLFTPYQALKTTANNERGQKNNRKVDIEEKKESAVFQTEFQKREARLITWRQSDAGKLAISNYVCRSCGKKGHMAKECRSPKKAQVFATTAVDDEITIEEYVNYFDVEEENRDGCEFQYGTDIANRDDEEENYTAFMVHTLDYESGGIPEKSQKCRTLQSVDFSDNSEFISDRELAQRRKKKSLKKHENKAKRSGGTEDGMKKEITQDGMKKESSPISSDDDMPPLASDSSDTDNGRTRLAARSRKPVLKKDKKKAAVPLVENMMPELLGEKYMAALSTQLQMKGSLNLDSQSSVNITPDEGILSDIKSCKPILIGGINRNGAPLRIAQAGNLDGIKVYYNPEAVCSILSQSKLLSSGAKLAFLFSKNKYILCPKDSLIIYTFSSVSIPGSLGEFYVSTLAQRAVHSSSVECHITFSKLVEEDYEAVCKVDRDTLRVLLETSSGPQFKTARSAGRTSYSDRAAGCKLPATETELRGEQSLGIRSADRLVPTGRVYGSNSPYTEAVGTGLQTVSTDSLYVGEVIAGGNDLLAQSDYGNQSLGIRSAGRPVPTGRVCGSQSPYTEPVGNGLQTVSTNTRCEGGPTAGGNGLFSQRDDGNQSFVDTALTVHSSRYTPSEKSSVGDFREGGGPANRLITPVNGVVGEIARVEGPQLGVSTDSIPSRCSPRLSPSEKSSVGDFREGEGPANRPEALITGVSGEIVGVLHAGPGVPQGSDTHVFATVANRQGFFTKREVDKAQVARDFQERMCFPTDDRMKKIVMCGTDFPFTIADVDNATFIWGPSASAIRGKEVHRKKLAGGPVIRPLAQRQNVAVEMDIMKIEDVSFLLGVMDNGYIMTGDLDKTYQMGAPNKSAKILFESIKEMISRLSGRGFVVNTICWDRESAITPIKSSLQSTGISVQQSAAGGHVGRAERAGRTLKNGVRCMIAHLDWIACKFLLVLLVHWVCRSINFQVHSQSMSGISPRQAVLGMIPNGRTDFRATFGDVVLAQVRETSNSVTTMRARDGIVVGAMDNREGSLLLLNPLTGRTFVADHFKRIPTPDTTKAYLNSLALKEGRTVKTVISVLDGPAEITRLEGEDDIPTGFFLPTPPVEEGVVGILDRAQEYAVEPLQVPQSIPLAVSPLEPIPVAAHSATPTRPLPLENASVDVFRSGGGSTARPSTPVNSVVREAVGESSRIRVAPGGLNLMDKFRGVFKDSSNDMNEMPKEYALTITVKKALQKYEGLASEVITEELSQMIKKKVWHPVSRSSLSFLQRKAVIRSSIFVKEKVKPDGVFDKLRARIVAGGDQQDKNLYGDLSAPTVSTTSFYSIIGIAAAEGRQVLSLDVGKAYLNADMEGQEVHMKIDSFLTGMLVALDPKYAPFVDEKGELTVKLDKALYGCVQSANLWYKHILATLEKGGFIRNQFDPCVLNKTNSQGIQCTLALHVDDIFASSVCPIMLAEFVALIKHQYEEFTVQKGPVLGHLGMTIVSVPGEVSATMQGCVDTLLQKSMPEGTAVTPATASLFNVREATSPGNRLATMEEFKKDRSLLALCLYMAKRTWPELLTAVSFLTTRVNVWDTDDHSKLDRMISYVRMAGNRGLRFAMGSDFTVRAWVDAAYGVHSDGKSQTGSVVTVGDFGTVHAKSVKQKIVTKSSTEAELVAVSDSANQGFFVRNFITAQGYKIGPLVIYQDNMSCMALLAAGRSSSERTRHIAIRYFWLKERVDNTEAVIEHKDGAELFANALTKPLQGPQFAKEIKGLTNW